MSVIIQKYSPDISSQYQQLLEESPMAMFNHSLLYRELLKAVLPETTDHYLCAFQRDELVAVLPTFTKQGLYGTVVNSLPFYGSHGGFVYKRNTDSEVFEALTNALHVFCEKVGAFSCTLIESPFDCDNGRYGRFKANLFDERIGQITPLPSGVGPDGLAGVLMGMYHQKTRNMVRKGMKCGFEVSHDGSGSTITALHAIHEENIRKIGGEAKPLNVFQSIAAIFEYDRDYRIYIAYKDGQIVSALLLFYFKDTVEYFCPATVHSYRSDQPLSLLIFTAMQDAILERGSRYWNWGGTWISQSGVYLFKTRWGTKDFCYRYHTKIKSDLKPCMFDKNVLINDYKYFYTIPFNVAGSR
jgi:hypothetical protein